MKILYWLGWSLTHYVAGPLLGVKVNGLEQVPKTGAFILASNHISYFDPPLVGSWIRRELFFFAKKELFDNKILGPIIWRTNARPVRRGAMDRDALKMSLKVLRDGYGLTVFPEGTRARHGKFLSPKPGIGLIAYQAKCPIVPCYISGANRPKDCILRRTRVTIDYGPPIEADWIKSQPAAKETYLRIAEEVMKRIASIKEERETANNSQNSAETPS